MDVDDCGACKLVEVFNTFFYSSETNFQPVRNKNLGTCSIPLFQTIRDPFQCQ